MPDREATHNLMYLIIGLIFGYAFTILWQEKHTVKPKEVAIIQQQIAHRNDTVRIIDSAIYFKKQRVHKISKKQVRDEFDSTFAMDQADTVIKHDTMVVTVDQARKCLELQVQHEGDSAKLMLDNRTLGAVDSAADSIKIEQPVTRTWSDIVKGTVVGAVVGALVTTLLVITGGK